MQLSRTLNIHGKEKIYKFVYFRNREYANPANGVKGEWFDDVLNKWLPIVNLETKKYIYENFYEKRNKRS